MTEDKTKYIKRSLNRSMECVERDDLREAVKNLIVACGYQVDETERLREQMRVDGELFSVDEVLVDPERVTNSKCTCHERDGSYVCDHCFSRGFRGHMQKGL